MSALRPDPLDHLCGRLSESVRPGGISLPGGGGKFSTDGSVQRWPGNTFVRHVDPASGAHGALRALQEALRTSRFAPLFAFLPPSSFHMTVFEGVSPERGDPARLPTGVAPDASRDACSAAMIDAIDGLGFPFEQRVRMRELFGAHSLTVGGIDGAVEASLRDARERLRAATGIRPTNFDDYVFHVTLAYPLEWLTEPTARELLAFADELAARYSESLADIPLGPLEFCHFETMHHFEPIRRLVRARSERSER